MNTSGRRSKSRFTFPRLLGLTIGLLAVAAGLALSLWQQQNLERSGSEFALQIAEEVLSTASAQPLIEQAHPRLLGSQSATSLQRYIESIPARLGPLQVLSAIRGSIDRPLLSFTGDGSSASYSIDLEFANEPAARAIVELQYNGASWQVSAFRVESGLLYD